LSYGPVPPLVYGKARASGKSRLALRQLNPR